MKKNFWTFLVEREATTGETQIYQPFMFQNFSYQKCAYRQSDHTQYFSVIVIFGELQWNIELKLPGKNNSLSFRLVLLHSLESFSRY